MSRWAIIDENTNEYHCQDTEPDGFGNMILVGEPYWDKDISKAYKLTRKGDCQHFIDRDMMDESGHRQPNPIKLRK